VGRTGGIRLIIQVHYNVGKQNREFEKNPINVADSDSNPWVSDLKKPLEKRLLT
jgi:hypothetical protein